MGFASDAESEPTFEAALAQWRRSTDSDLPLTGWREVERQQVAGVTKRVSLARGDRKVSVLAIGGGWLVEESTAC